MPGKALPYQLAIAIVGAAAIIAIFIIGQGNTGTVVEGVLIQSPEGETPQALFSEIIGEQSFIISPAMHDPVQVADSTMFNGTALFIQVLQGNNKGVIQLLRVFDAGGNLSYCLTNLGDLMKEERLTVEECNAMLQEGGSAIVLIEQPDKSQAMPSVFLGKKKIAVLPVNYADLGNDCFLALRIMFPNAQEIIDKSNSAASAARR